MLFVLGHTRQQHVTLAIREGFLYSMFFVKVMFALVYVPLIRFKINRIVYDTNHTNIGGRCNVCFPG